MLKFLKFLRREDPESIFSVGDCVRYVGHLSEFEKGKVYTILKIIDYSIFKYQDCYLLDECTIPVFDFELNPAVIT